LGISSSHRLQGWVDWKTFFGSLALQGAEEDDVLPFCLFSLLPMPIFFFNNHNQKHLQQT
jgi:hypothetical protein